MPWNETDQDDSSIDKFGQELLGQIEHPQQTDDRDKKGDDE